MALGQGATVVGDNGLVTYKSGTSFSSPIMCGMVACLWQAFPALTNKEIIEVVRQSSDIYDHPNKDYGYGIPDMKKAMEIAQQLVDKKIAVQQPLKKGKK
jgi:Subtilase family.